MADTESSAVGPVSGSSRRTCDACGHTLPADAPGGLCPVCLRREFLSDESDASSVPPLEAGDIFGDYELLGEIARGGMGIVYRARQHGLDRLVALKLIESRQESSPEFVARFETEARAAASLDHPNVVPIYEVGEHDGRHFFAMKLVEGCSLAERISNLKSRIPNREAAKLLATIARAVNHAHQRGVLHRDLKPSNILLDAQGEPHLTDFGLARLLQAESFVTKSSAAVGTPAYMSPEQAAGGTRQLTIASDVFSLGAILYELLSGRPPFLGQTPVETLRRVIDEEPAPLRPQGRVHAVQASAGSNHLKNSDAKPIKAGTPNVDRDLEIICLKCLSKEPEARYSTALELAQDLERWLSGETILARRATTPERFWRWAKRNQLVASLGVAVLALLIVVTIGSTIAALRVRAAQDETRGQVARMLVSEGNRLQREGDALRALPAFVAALKAEPQPDLQRVHRVRIGSVLSQVPQPVGMLFLGSPINSMKLSPGGRIVAIGTTEGQLVLWDIRNLDTSRTLRGVQEEIRSRFGEENVYDLTAGMRTPSSARSRRGVLDTAFSSDGVRVAACDENGEASVWDTNSGKLLSPALTHNGRIYRILFSPDGRFLATGSADHTVKIWSTETWKQICPDLRHESEVTAIAFSPDNKCLVTGEYLGELRQWSLSAGTLVDGTRAHTDVVVALAFDAKGETLISASGDGSCSVWSFGNRLTLQRRFVMETRLRHAAIDPTGKRVLVLGGTEPARLYDPHSSEPVAEISPAGFFHGSFSGDGRRCVVAGLQRIVLILDAATGARLTPPLPHGNRALYSILNENGSILLTADADGIARCWSLGLNANAEGPLPRMQAGSRGFPSCDARQWFVEQAQGWRVAALDSPENASGPVAIADGVGRAIFSLDNHSLLVLGDDLKSARLFDPGSGQQIAGPYRFTNSIARLAIHPHGDSILATFTGRENELRYLDAKDGRDLMPPLKMSAEIKDCDFSPDGQHFAIQSGQTVQIRRTHQGEYEVEIHHPGTVSRIQFSPDGHRIVTACKSGGVEPLFARVWEVPTGAPITPPLAHRDGVMDATFSADGKRIVTGGEDGIAQVWDAATGQPVSSPFSVTDGFVQKSVISPDGSLIAIYRLKMLRDTLWYFVIIWDAVTGQQVGDLFRTSRPFTRLVWMPNSREIVGLAENGESQRWRLIETDFSAAKLETFSQVLTAHRIDAIGNVVTVNAAELQQAWERWHKEAIMGAMK